MGVHIDTLTAEQERYLDQLGRGHLIPPPEMLAPADVIRLEDDAVVLLDQTRLPGERVDRRCASVPELCQAIRDLAIRGAPAIGIAAAYGHGAGRARLAAARERRAASRAGRRPRAPRGSRPTAVNLGWALDAATRSIAPPRIPARCARRSPRRAAHPRRRRRALHGDGPARRRAARRRARACSRTATPARSPRAATARRSASCARRTRAIQALHVLGRRDAPAAAGRAPDGVGAAQDGIPHDADRGRRRRRS